MSDHICTGPEWIEAVWAEAPEVPAGWRRLAWRAGGVQLITREALMRRSIGTAALFAAAAAAAAWAAWPGPPAYLAVSDHRALVIATIVVLAGLPLPARRLFGPASRSRQPGPFASARTPRSWPSCRPGTLSRGSVTCRRAQALTCASTRSGAPLVTALGTGTTALILKRAWLRNWLYHGQHQFFGIAGLRSLLDGDLAAIACSHELTASVDTPIFLVMCVAFPLIALVTTGLAALGALGSAETEQGGDPPRGGGGPPAPKTVTGGPGGAQLTNLTRHGQPGGWIKDASGISSRRPRTP